MENESHEDDQLDEEFCRNLVEKVPETAPLLEEHLKDQGGELLAYIFMSGVAEWAEKNAEAKTADVVQLLAVLNQGLAEGKRDVPNLIVVGFVEWLLRDTPLKSLLQGELKAWHDFHTGASESHPFLRRGD
ncbi:hypothetical protein G7067_06830 [Leucobacter insecticola]|uniref:DUF7674 domain-containing protein n=1 Tax=Leucobacter insecticola TaxID=2714934 RepID=A0A6G8FIC5_9MICO|nr:hypothetical protein [Leucobacter insecticola]QIM16200.1 hypothetical protein G7067_06830 [Leucobacter insecticola]